MLRSQELAKGEFPAWRLLSFVVDLRMETWMLLSRWSLLMFVQIFCVLATATAAETRLALVIGNAEYETVGGLRNPANDARLVADALEQVGFKVELVVDGTLSQMGDAISDFGKELREAGEEATGLFYFAGHGVQSFGENFILPTDVALSDAADLGIVSIEVASVLRQMRSARNATNIVILDACRNNPFDSVLELDDNGLAEMDAPSGSFIAMSTAPGAVAFDGIGNNTPFSEALASQILVPGQTIEDALRNVRITVVEQTQGLQTPWDTSSLLREFRFVEVPAPSEEEIAALQLWNAAKDSGDPLQLMIFLQNNPESVYAGEARALIESYMETASQQTVPDADMDTTSAYWAAVAVNTSTGMYGIATGDLVQDGANARAIDFCLEFSNGQEGCRVVLSTPNCGAVAIGNGKFFAAEAGDRETAGSLALGQCQATQGSACFLDSSFCSSE